MSCTIYVIYYLVSRWRRSQHLFPLARACRLRYHIQSGIKGNLNGIWTRPDCSSCYGGKFRSKPSRLHKPTSFARFRRGIASTVLLPQNAIRLKRNAFGLRLLWNTCLFRWAHLRAKKSGWSQMSRRSFATNRTGAFLLGKVDSYRLVG